jgi:hypothetical protein
MPDDELKPDPNALEEWKKLPQHEPSRQSLPPATGGMRWAWGLLIVLGLIALVAVLAQVLPL